MIAIKLSLYAYPVLHLIAFAVALSSGTPSATTTVSTASTNQNIKCVDCAIIGGGPAGLAASIAVAKAAPSRTIAIYERDSFQPKGASIAISAAGWNSIKQMDLVLVKEIKKTSSPVTSVEIKAWHGDETKNEKGKRQIIFKIGLRVAVSVLRFFKGAVNYTHLWHDVRMVLAERANEVYHAEDAEDAEDESGTNANANNNANDNASDNSHGGTKLLNLNCSLENIRPLEVSDLATQQEGARFKITVNENGQPKIVHAKIVIACDGSMSKVRALLPNEPDVLIDEHKSVWRGVTPTSTNGEATFYADKNTGRSAIIFPAGKSSGASWTVISQAEAGKSTTDAEARSRLAKVIGDLNDDAFKQAIDDSPIVIENKLHVRDFDKPWKSSYDGLAYVGDAAHPVRPTGEGTALAFEDTNVLGGVVAEYGLTVEALRAYEDKRYEPVKRISDQVRKQAQLSYAKLDVKKSKVEHSSNIK